MVQQRRQDHVDSKSNQLAVRPCSSVVNAPDVREQGGKLKAPASTHFLPFLCAADLSNKLDADQFEAPGWAVILRRLHTLPAPQIDQALLSHPALSLNCSDHLADIDSDCDSDESALAAADGMDVDD